MRLFGDTKLRLGFAIFVLVVSFLASVGILLAKEFAKPAAKPAKTYPLHDEHADEGATAAVDPYDNAEKAQIFNVKWNEEGFLPIFLVVTNDGDQPISLAGMQAQLITGHRYKIPAASNDELYRRLAHVSASGPKYPLPFPRTKVKGAVGKKALDEMDAAQFSAKAVEPHSTQSGFVFFDVREISSPLAGARFYLTGLRNGKGGELLYFEIPFEK
ncbi:MAG: hypothetical protein WA628_12320 [Terriglobales bacterium]